MALRPASLPFLIGLLLALALSPPPAVARVFQRNGDGSLSAISTDGRFVVFGWGGLTPGNPDPACSNDVFHVFVLDTVSGTTTCVSVSSTGMPANGDSGGGTISADGSLVAFRSRSTNLDPACAGNPDPLFVRNRASGTTACIPDAVDTPRFLASGFALSGNGRVLAFPGPMPGCGGVDPVFGPPQIVLRDLVTGSTTCGTVSGSGVPGSGFSGGPALSADGRFLVFSSQSTNLAPPCAPGPTEFHLFVRDTLAGTTRCVSLGNDGMPLPFPPAFSVHAAVSADGRFVAFEWLEFPPSCPRPQATIRFPPRLVLLRDLVAGTTTCVSVSSTGEPGNFFSEEPSISDDGRFVSFNSIATNLTAPCALGFGVYVRDVVAGTTTCVSGGADGSVANDDAFGQMSGDGRIFAVQSEATNLLPDGLNRGGLFLATAPLGDVPVVAAYDGRADVAVYRPTDGRWSVLRATDGGVRVTFWGAAGLGDVPVPADYDGDGQADLAVYRGTTGQWLIRRSSDLGTTVIGWGAPAFGDVPVPADYDGDGHADIAVYRGTTGQWFVRRSSDGGLMTVGWGAPPLGDVPVPADYDGDGHADIAVYRGTTGQWFILRSSDNAVASLGWGAPALGDLPVPADYDGDTKADVAVYRGTTGEWFIRRSSDGGLTGQAWGAPALGDLPVPADYDGDGHADVAVYRRTTGDWLVLRSSDATLGQIFFGARP